jgi:surfactin synthase thioesterase subunit
LTPEPRPGASFRLLCFHHGGGGAFGFAPWAGLLRPEVELVAVQLPGRENRFSETAYTDGDELLPRLVEHLADATQLPYATFGHSLGGSLSFLLAQRLERLGELPPPRRLFVSAARLPPAQDGVPAAPITDAWVMERLRVLGGTPASVLADPELLGAFMPMLRADFQLARRLRRDPTAARLSAPISVLAGRADDSLTEGDLAAWRDQSRAEVDVRSFPGGHFFVRDDPGAVVRWIEQKLAPDLAAASPAAPGDHSREPARTGWI